MKGVMLAAAVSGVVLPGFGQMTESPSVVPVGQYWIEADAAAWGHDRHTPTREGTRYQQFDVGSILLTTGIMENVDAQVQWAGWTKTEQKTASGDRDVSSGWGDLWARAKWNFRGDESQSAAWAWLPYLKVPVGGRAVGNGHWEPGLALVYGAPWGGGNWIEAMVSVDALHSDGGGRHAAWFTSAVVGGTSGWYAEVAASSEPEIASHEIPVALGVGYARELSGGLTADFEIVVGLNREATDLVGILRFTWVFDRTGRVGNDARRRPSAAGFSRN